MTSCQLRDRQPYHMGAVTAIMHHECIEELQGVSIDTYIDALTFTGLILSRHHTDSVAHYGAGRKGNPG
jgi:hypothetical protein